MISTTVNTIKYYSNEEKTKGLRIPVPIFTMIMAEISIMTVPSEGQEPTQLGNLTAALIGGGSELLLLPGNSFGQADSTGFMVKLIENFKIDETTKDLAEASKAMMKAKVESLLSTGYLSKIIADVTANVSESVTASINANTTSTGTESTTETPETTTTTEQQQSAVIESSNPGPEGREAGRFTDPKTGQEVIVLAKEGESDEEAMARVKKNHGL